MTTFLISYYAIGVFLTAIRIFQKRMYRHLDGDLLIEAILGPLAWPFALRSLRWGYFRSKENEIRGIMVREHSMIPEREWLERSISVGELGLIERRYQIFRGSDFYEYVWNPFFSKKGPDDEIWSFVTPRMGHHQWSGYAIVRNKNPVDGIWHMRALLGDEKDPDYKSDEPIW